jgi:replicative DNA helicase
METPSLDLNILKSLINNRKCALEFAQEGSEQLFHPDLWRFARVILDHIKIYKEVPTKRVILEKLKTSKNEALTSYVEKLFVQLEKIQYNEVEYKPDLEKMKIRYQDYLIHGLRSSLQENHDLTKNIVNLQSVLTQIKNVNAQRIYAQSSLKNSVDNFIDRLKARKDNPNLEKGICTGFTSLDYLNNGFKSPEYVIIAGNTGAGKSTLLLSFAAGMYLQNNSILNDKFYGDGHSIIFFSLEMPLDECTDRLISCLSGVPLRTIKSAQLTPEQETKLNKTLKFIKNYSADFEIVDIPKGATTTQLESIYNDYCETKKKPSVVVVDYLNIMQTDQADTENDWLNQAEISEELYRFARVNNLVLLTGVQLNETGKPEKNDTNIGTHRIGRSKAILHSSTMAMMLEKRVGEETYPTMNVHLIKNRRGPLGKFSIRKNLECCSFLNDTGFGENAQEGDISSVMDKLAMKE